jgi:hypothetical protein
LALKVECYRTRLEKSIQDFDFEFGTSIKFDDLEASLEKSPIKDLENHVQFWKLIEQALFQKMAIENCLKLNLKIDSSDKFSNMEKIKILRCKELDQLNLIRNINFLKEVREILNLWEATYHNFIEQINSINPYFKKINKIS